MADDITTVLKFVGDATAATKSIDDLIRSLQGASKETNSLFADMKRGGADAAAAVRPLADGTERIRRTVRDAASATLAFAQASARLQTAQGNAAGAVNTLKGALEQVDQKTVAAVRAQTQLVGIEAQLATAASKAETQILREAQAIARLQQISGQTPAAIKTLADALASVGNKTSLPALRAELQKTYLETDYNNSPLITAIRSIAKGFTSLQPILGTAGANISKLTASAQGVSSSFAGISASAGAAAAAIVGITVTVGAAVVAFSALVSAGEAVVNALIKIGQEGIAANAQIESIQVGIATVIGSVADFRNDKGIQLKGVDALNAAIPVAADQMRKLQIDSLKTSATLDQLAPAFQAAIGPGKVAGLTIDQIRETTIKLTQAVTALGLPLEQIRQETRGILSGDIDRNTQAAIALGITKKDFDLAVKRGQAAEFLNEKLAVAAASGELVAKTFAAAQSNFNEAVALFEKTVTGGLFEQLKKTVNDLLPQIFDVEAADLINKQFSGIASSLTRIFDTAGLDIAQIIGKIVEGIKLVSGFLDRNQEQIGGIVGAIDAILRLIVESAAEIFKIIGLSGDWGERLDVINTALSFIARLVGLITDSFKITISAVVLVGNAIKTALIAPLEAVLFGLSAITGVFSTTLSAQINSARETFSSLRKDSVQGTKDAASALAKSIREVGDSGSRAIKRIDEARKRAKDGQRAVDGLGAGVPGSTATINNKPTPKLEDKKAAAAARAAARAELKELQELEKEAELANKRINARLNQALQDRLISLEAYTEAAADNEAGLLQVRLKALDEEERAAIRAAKSIQEIEAKKAEFSRKRAEIELDAELKIEGFRDDLRRTQEKAEESHQERLTQIRDVGRRALERALDDAAKKGQIGLVDAEEAQREIERERLAEREAQLNRELAAVKENEQERARINDELQILAAERAAFEQEASRKIIDAQKAEAKATAETIKDRVKAAFDLRKAQIDAAAADAILRKQRGSLTARDAEKEEIGRRIELLRIESAERQLQIGEEAAQQTKRAEIARQGAGVILQIEKEKNAALQAERTRAAAEEQALREQQRALELSPGFGDAAAGRIAGVEEQLGRQLTLWEQNRVAMNQYSDELEERANESWEKAKNVLGNLTDATTAAVDAFVESGGSLKAAGKAFAAALAAPFIEAAKTRAAFEFAQAIASLAVFDFRGFALHSLAGAGFAALAAIGTRLVGGGGASAGAGAAVAGGGSSSSANNNDPQTPREIRQSTPLNPTIQPTVIQIQLRAEQAPGVVVDLIDRNISGNGVIRDAIRREARIDS